MGKGSIVAVCRSARKGVPKQSVDEGRLVQGHGLDHDAHAGRWHRQVSILDIGDIREMEAKGLTLRPGAFGENLVIADINTADLGLGSRLKLGQSEIEITQIGKVCHDRCAIYYSAGDCIMPRRGLFAEVRVDGSVRAGDPVEIIHQVPRDQLQVAVLTDVRGAGSDIVQRLEADGDVHVAWSGSDSESPLSPDTIHDLCGRGLDLLVVVSSDRHGFSSAVDPGSEVAGETVIHGRVSRTLVALIDEDNAGQVTDAVCENLLAQVRQGATPCPVTLPTLLMPSEGA